MSGMFRVKRTRKLIYDRSGKSFEEARQAMVEYNGKNKNDRWKATRRIEKDIRANLRDIELELLNKADCIITPLTLYRIREQAFLKILIPHWNRHLSSVDIKIDQVSQDSPSYIYTSAGHPDLMLLITHHELAYNFGNILLEQLPLLELTARNVVTRSVLYQTPSSLRLVLAAIRDNAPTLGLQVEEVDEIVGRTILRSIKDQTYLQTNIKGLAEKAAHIVLYQEGRKALEGYLQGHNVQRLTTEQLRLQRDAAREFAESQRIDRKRV